MSAVDIKRIRELCSEALGAVPGLIEEIDTLRGEIAKILRSVREIETGGEPIGTLAEWCTWCFRKCDANGECACP